MMLTTPAGRIRAQSSPNLSVVSGVVGAGLATTVFPARRAGATLIVKRIIGTFHGGDRRDDAEGPVLPDHLLRGILFEHLERQIERGEVAEHRDRVSDLPLRLRQRPALLLGQEVGEFVLPGFERFGQFDQQRTPSPERCRRPGGERRLRCGHRFIELCPIRPGRCCQNPPGRGVDHVEGAGALDQLSIDQ